MCVSTSRLSATVMAYVKRFCLVCKHGEQEWIEVPGE